MGIEQDAAAFQQQQAATDPMRAALLGGALGVGGGLVGNLMAGIKERQAKKRFGVTLPDATTVPVPVKLANDLLGNMWERTKLDPTYTTKMVGAFSLPLLGGFALTRGLNKMKKKVTDADNLQAAQQNYQSALADYAGAKVASEKSALDRLADLAAGETPATEKSALLGGLLGDATLGQTVNQGANAYLPLLLGATGVGAYMGYNRAKKNDKSEATLQAIKDWDRKRMFATPPPVQAVAAPLPEEKAASPYQSRVPYLAHLPGSLMSGDPLSAIIAGAQKPTDVDDYYRNRGQASTYIGNTGLGATLGGLGGAAAGVLGGMATDAAGVSSHLPAGMPQLIGAGVGGATGLLGGGLAGLLGTQRFENQHKKKDPTQQ